MDPSVRAVVSTLGDLALSSLGPAGRSKIIGATPSAPAGVMTSCSARLFTSLHVRHPYGQFLLQLTLGAQQHVDGGGLLAVHVACALLTATWERCGDSHARRMAMAQGFQSCLEDVARLLGQHLAHAKRPGAPVHPRNPRRQGGDDEAHMHKTPAMPALHISSGSDSDSGEEQEEEWGAAGGCPRRPASQSVGAGPRPLPPPPPEALPESAPWRFCLRCEGPGALSAYLGVARGALGSKPATGLSPEAKEAACLVLVRAMVASLPDAPAPQQAGGSAAHLPALPRVLVVPGLCHPAFDLVPGVLADLRPPPGVLRALPLGPCLVALFDVALEPSGGYSGVDNGGGPAAAQGQLRLEDDGRGAWSPALSDLAALLRVLRALSALGVRLLACQKGILPEVAHAALALGMLPLARLSAQHAQALAQVSGAAPISHLAGPLLDLPPPTAPHSAGAQARGAGWGATEASPGAGGAEGGLRAWGDWLGVVGGVCTRVDGHRHLVHILPPASSSSSSSTATREGQPPDPGPVAQALERLAPRSAPRRRPCHTVLLGAPSDSSCDELQAAASAALRTLGRCAQLPLVLPGGGAAEAVVAVHARRWARRRRARAHGGRGAEATCGLLQADAYDAVAAALEAAAAQLMAGSGIPSWQAHDAVLSLGEHVMAQLPSAPSACAPASAPQAQAPRELEFVGWEHRELRFQPVARCRLDPPPPGAPGGAWTCSAPSAPPHGEAPGGEAGMLGAAGLLLDWLPAKLSAISAGVTAACTLMQVDGVVDAAA